MDEMERIGRERKVDKAMLTCLKRVLGFAKIRMQALTSLGNTTALSFYSKYGYVPISVEGLRLMGPGTKLTRSIRHAWRPTRSGRMWVLIKGSRWITTS